MVDNGKLAGILDPKSQGISPATQGLDKLGPCHHWIGWGQPVAAGGTRVGPQPCATNPPPADGLVARPYFQEIQTTRAQAFSAVREK